MRRWTLLVLSGCAIAIGGCATPARISRAAPRIETPAEAKRACEIYRLPAAPTIADLEIGYATRGSQILACDAARRLAVDTHDAEHALEDEALKVVKRR